jgi:hypothetical protein
MHAPASACMHAFIAPQIWTNPTFLGHRHYHSLSRHHPSVGAKHKYAFPQKRSERIAAAAKTSWLAQAGPSGDQTATSRRRFTSGAAAAVSAALLSGLTPVSCAAVDTELYKNLQVDNPYLLMEPAGKSFRGNKGPNLELPDELTEEDDEPEELSARFKQKSTIDLLENLSLVELAASALWGTFFYFGIFDISVKSNVVSQASGGLDAVRPSDWFKVKLGAAVGESQKDWDEDYKAPLSIQAFTVSVFLMIGVLVDRSIVSGAGDVSGYFALSSGAVGCLWAGFYELGRMQKSGYRASRQEQAEMDAEWQDFLAFAEERLELRPTGRLHISEVNRAFRQMYAKYRTTDQMTDDSFKKYFRAYIRPRTGQKGRQGFFKGVALKEQASAFGEDAKKMQWKRQEEARRELEVWSPVQKPLLVSVERDQKMLLRLLQLSEIQFSEIRR